MRFTPAAPERSTRRQLVLDSYREVLVRVGQLGLIPLSLLMLISSLSIDPTDPDWFRESIGVFRWTDPFATLSVLATVAVAIQVAVHSLRLQESKGSEESESSRVELFAVMAGVVAGFVIVGALCTVVYSLAKRDDATTIGDLVMIVVAAIGTAVLCVDAARVVTTKALQIRLGESKRIQSLRIERLSNAMRGLPRRGTAVWLGAAISTSVMLLAPSISAAFSFWTVPPALRSQLITVNLLLAAVLLTLNMAIAATVGVHLIASTDTTLSYRLAPLLFILMTVAGEVAVGIGLLRSGDATNQTSGLLLITYSLLVPLVCFLAFFKSTGRESHTRSSIPEGIHSLVSLIAVKTLDSNVKNGFRRIEGLNRQLDKANEDSAPRLLLPDSVR